MAISQVYRWAVLLLAAGYSVEVAATADYGAFGAQFRYLTIWALTGNLVAAAAMLSPRWGARDERGDTVLSVLAVLNLLVVFSYWRLFFTDPTLVNGDRTPQPYREYYLHLAGPVLMWIDLFTLKHGFRRVLPVVVWLGAVVLAYVAWAELLVQPFNTAPVGEVSAGLPYPFLNDMPLPARALFYLSIFGTGVLFALGFYALGWVVRRSSSRSAASPLR